jgi:hypothetical protein
MSRSEWLGKRCMEQGRQAVSNARILNISENDIESLEYMFRKRRDLIVQAADAVGDLSNIEPRDVMNVVMSVDASPDSFQKVVECLISCHNIADIMKDMGLERCSYYIESISSMVGDGFKKSPEYVMHQLSGLSYTIFLVLENAVEMRDDTVMFAEAIRGLYMISEDDTDKMGDNWKDMEGFDE